MALDGSRVGDEIGRIYSVVDARWLMSYAAGIPDERPELFDTIGGLVVHPMFPVAPEWDLLVRHRSAPRSMPTAEIVRGVHSAHDVIIDRPIGVGATVTIRAVVVGVDRRVAGATQRVRFEAVDAAGQTLWRTMLTSVFIGVELAGEPSSIDVDWPSVPARTAASGVTIDERHSVVHLIDAHVYSECARIWNPIHTDVATARAAGLPAPILHGTATMARAVSACADMAEVRLADVRRVGGSFAAMVPLGSTIDIRLLEVDGSTLHFDVVDHEGRRAIRDGFIQLRS